MGKKDKYEENAKMEPGTEPWIRRFRFLVLGCLALNTMLLLLGYALIHHSAGHQFLDELMKYDGIRRVSGSGSDYHEILKAVDKELMDFNAVKQQSVSLSGGQNQPEPLESAAEPPQTEPLNPAAQLEMASPAESAAMPEGFLDWFKDGIPRDEMLNNSFINVEIMEGSLLNGEIGDAADTSDGHELKLKFSRSAMQSITQQEGIIYIQIRIPDHVSKGRWNGTVSMEGRDINSGSFGAVGIYKNSSAVTRFQSTVQKEEKEVDIEYEGGDYIGIKFDITLSGGEFQCILTQE